MEEAYFSKEDGERIARAVRKIEEVVLRNKWRGRGFGIEGVPVELTEDLLHDESATAKVLTADEDEPYTLTAASDASEVTVWPWKIPSGKKLPSGHQLLAVWWDGRLYAFVVDDCWESA